MLVIEDDGSGLPPDSGQHGFGLTGMRERVTALGGTLTHFLSARHACQRFSTSTLCLRFDDVAVSESACRCAIND